MQGYGSLEHLEEGWREWPHVAETDWCRVHDLRGQNKAVFVGPANNLEMRFVSLGSTLAQEDLKRGLRVEIVPQMFPTRCRTNGGTQERAGVNVRPSFLTSQVFRSPAHSPQPRCRNCWPVWSWTAQRRLAGTGLGSVFSFQLTHRVSTSRPSGPQVDKVGQPRHARALLARPPHSPRSMRSSASWAGPGW